ncbi:MAG: hypothetical protein MUP71_08835 [Candidatus Aminicenantes bacterium]|nr:hypothetical protein [Candidatus Aminicenantes bacterium]
MQILFNELSLTGQFHDQDAFIKNGLLLFVGVLKEMQRFSTVLLKRSDAWNKMITPSITLHSFLINNAFRKSDEVRRWKLAIVDLTKEPFWDHDSKQNPDSTYLLDGADIRGSSSAEACERDKAIVSFVSSSASIDPLNIIRNGINVPLLNLTRSGKLIESLWTNKHISFESYLKTRFSGGKLDFSKVEKKIDFNKIQSEEQFLFIGTFKKIEGLTWDQVYSDKGLDYKEYHGNISVHNRSIKTYKFRASKKIRCHGYREKDSFVIVGFEIDHKLSDRG